MIGNCVARWVNFIVHLEHINLFLVNISQVNTKIIYLIGNHFNR